MFQPKRLSELRKQKNLTQEGLAVKVNTTKGTISNYENGYSTPPHEILVAIADNLVTTTDYLLGRTDDPLCTKNLDDDEKIEFKTFIHNPKHGIFFKEYLEAPEERKKELMMVWRIIKDAEKGRKLGNHQDE